MKRGVARPRRAGGVWRRIEDGLNIREDLRFAFPTPASANGQFAALHIEAIPSS